MSKSYCFETKAQIKARILSDDNYALSCLVELWNRQTAFEQSAKTTVTKNRIGFMSSHAVTGSKLAEKVQSGESLTDEEMSKARSIISSYTRQLASFSRSEALAANPELAAVAAIFGVG